MEFLTTLLEDSVAIAAISFIVVIFLNHQKRYADRLESISIQCHQMHEDSQKHYQDQLKILMDAHQKQMYETVQALQRFSDTVDRLDESAKELARTVNARSM